MKLSKKLERRGGFLKNYSYTPAEVPVIFGEVLFDQFPGSGAVLGGAPFNAAWHLQGFGLKPLMVSRVGRDSLGEKVLESMKSWDMDIRGIQVDPHYPTGTVQVHLEEGEPRYNILPDQAYDYIDTTQALKALEKVKPSLPSLLYHGSLALRNETSRSTWNNLRAAAAGAPIFIDINLREPWWDMESIWSFLREARWAKMNDSELSLVLQKFPDSPLSLENQDIPPSAVNTAAVKLYRQINCSLLIVTLGARGALLTSGTETWQKKPVPVKDMVDTVGAGDAFSAVNILGLTRGWEPQVILERSLEFASRILQIQGAAQNNPALYQYFMRRWKL